MMRMIKMKLIIKILLVNIFTLSIYAQDTYISNCRILEDENSILCKYKAPPSIDDRIIVVNWIAPHGEISRSRELEILAGYISVYDYRYLEGREPGIWTFEVIDGDVTTRTKFTVKKKDI